MFVENGSILYFFGPMYEFCLLSPLMSEYETPVSRVFLHGVLTIFRAY